jgi:ATP-dependent protease ClpP protease subunit
MKKSWYRIQAAAGGQEAEVYIYGEIGWDIPVAQFVKDLAAIKAPKISFRMHSPGGFVFDGMAIYQAIKRHPAAEKTMHIDGMAASMASVIALAADRVEMAKGGFYMIHRPEAIAIGNGDDMRKTAALVDKVEEELVSIYADQADQTKRQVRAWMAEETWFTADEAKAAGFVDAVTDGDVIKADFDMSYPVAEDHSVRRAFVHPPAALVREAPAAEGDDPAKPDTVRKFEAGLREKLGFSRAEAEAIARDGFRKEEAPAEPRDEDDEPWVAEARWLSALLNHNPLEVT